jgi:hypothetical protein
MKMVCIELKPNLSSCIETVSKKEYERTLNLPLKEGPVDEKPPPLLHGRHLQTRLNDCNK